MDRKQLCIANLSYKQSSSDEAKRMKNLLGYLTYRDSRDEGAKMVAGQQRWTDRGMGGSVAAIAQRCDDLRSNHVLAFNLVVNPNPQLVAMIAHDEREAFVRELTENVVDDFFEARGLDTGCEFSYVVHHRDSDDPQSPGMHNPHTHTVLPGTVWSEESGQRVNLYFSQSRKVDHIAMLHDVTERNMADMLERYVGPDWERRMDALETLRDEQKQVARNEEAHGIGLVDDQPVRFWCGVRQTDERQCAVGYYLSHEDDHVFRPIVSGLSREQAEHLSRSVSSGLRNYPDLDQLALYREAIRILLEQGFDDLAPPEPPTSSFDISFDL